MRIKVKLEGKTKGIEMKKGISMSELARELNIVLQNYITRVNDRIVPDDEKLKRGDRVEFFRVISGG